jgi:hypothetical protein
VRVYRLFIHPLPRLPPREVMPPAVLASVLLAACVLTACHAHQEQTSLTASIQGASDCLRSVLTHTFHCSVPHKRERCRSGDLCQPRAALPWRALSRSSSVTLTWTGRSTSAASPCIHRKEPTLRSSAMFSPSPGQASVLPPACALPLPARTAPASSHDTVKHTFTGVLQASTSTVPSSLSNAYNGDAGSQCYFNLGAQVHRWCHKIICLFWVFHSLNSNSVNIPRTWNVRDANSCREPEKPCP